MLTGRRNGKVQAFTAQANWGIPRFRLGVAMAYAAGTNLIVPWDQYQVQVQERLYLDPKDLADLYGFVRGIAPYLDDYEDAAVAGRGFRQPTTVAGKSVAEVTGGGKVTVWLRVKPKDRAAPVVVHLTEAEAGAPSTLRLHRSLIFGGDAFTAELLTPVPYNARLHDDVWEAANTLRQGNEPLSAKHAPAYAPLVHRAPIALRADGEHVIAEIPALTPWGVLVLRVAEVRSP